MNKNFGGDQNKMRDIIIKDLTYLGPFDHLNKLQVNQIQSMQFKEGDTGPFYLSEEKKEELKFDTIASEIEKKEIHTGRTDQ